MDNYQLRRLLAAIRERNKVVTTEYCPCQVCNGRGYINSSVVTTSLFETCYYCNGAKTVIKSVTKELNDGNKNPSNEPN